MTAERKKLVLGAGAAVVLLAVVVWALAGGSRGAGADGGGERLTMVCQNPACKSEFEMTPAEAQTFLQKHPGDSIHCPKCNGTNLRQAGKGDRNARVEPARGKR